ncbi:hypothetical protein FACS1894216_01270 [Synergistales bacterium]|nr:hypothetical protein FACS1894216_01270 [Synergistales bacterium]
MPSVVVDERGITVPSFDEYRAYMANGMRSIFGEDIYLEPDSQDGQMIDIFAFALTETAQAIANAYHSFGPNSAVGVGLSRMVKINGIRRHASTKSTVDVRIVGQVGTSIRNGIVEDNSRNKWDLPRTVTIPEAGEIVVTATAKEYGAIYIIAGDLTGITTPTRGWQTVENIAPSAPGAPVESDYELRIRQRYSTALPAQTVNDGILGSVLNVFGVVKARLYENYTDEPDADGIPGHSICVVAEGGDINEVAEAIRLRKTPGTGTFGGIEVDVTDALGIKGAIRFARPTIVNISVRVTITVAPKYDAASNATMAKNLSEYVDGLKIGAPVLLYDLYIPIKAADTSIYAPTYRVSLIEVSADGGETWSGSDVDIAFNELARVRESDVFIVIGDD